VKKRKLHKRNIVISSLVGLFLLLLLPPPNPLLETSYSTLLTSREGEFLSARIATDEQWRFPASDSASERFKIALLRFEDRYFYKHPGINPVSLLRAIYLNIKNGRVVSGGSTLTMQLARMARNNQPRTLFNKILELWLALRIEIYYSKEEIFKHYSAHAPFGGNVVGIDAASWRYFGRPPKDLSWSESASLAVLPNAPGLIFPGSRDSLFLNKRNRLLLELKESGYLNEIDYSLALTESLPSKPLALKDEAPHLTERVIREQGKGKLVVTSINYKIQERLNELVNNYYEAVRYKEIHNVAVLVNHIKTGEVMAYIGNVNFNNYGDHGGQVDIIDSKRSPGSLLKPVLYALAMDEGMLSPKQLLPDIPLYYKGFAPQNFDKRFMGAVHADKALQSSLNVPFVNLLKDYGYENLLAKLNRMGLESMDKEAGHYGLTMILGGGEVKLWEINSLYSGMARTLIKYNSTKGVDRYYSEEYMPLSYYPKKDNFAFKTDEKEGLISAGAIWLTFEAMKELSRPGSISNWKKFSSTTPISWKTGTSYGHKDAWSVGLNDQYVVGVWLGNADGEGRPDLIGTQMAAPLMFEVFSVLSNMDGATKERLYAPIANLHKENTCKISGFRAGPNCKEVIYDYLPNAIVQPPACPHHKQIFLNEDQDFQVNASCYPIHKMVKENWFVLPASQSYYYRKHNHSYQSPPDFLSDCNSQNERVMEMVYPKNHAKLYIPIEIDGKPGQAIFQVAHHNQDTPIFWHLDGEYIGMTRQIHKMGFSPPGGQHKLDLIDKNGFAIEVNFNVIN